MNPTPTTMLPTKQLEDYPQLQNILVVGPSGSGKSSSLENLNPETTKIINPERKALPFRNAKRFKNHVQCATHGDVILELIKAGTDLAIDTVVIESFQTVDELVLSYCRDTYKGWDIFMNHNKIIRDMLNQSKLLSHAKKKAVGGEIIPPKFVIWTALDELVDINLPDGGKKTTRRCKVDGRELQGAIEKEFVIVLFTEILPPEPPMFKDMRYRFRVNTDGICSAKTPKDMFKDMYIPNDLNLVVEACRKYNE